MERISYAKYLASPQYRKFPFDGLIGWIVGNFPLSVEDLQSKYDFAYYSTMVKAVTDVNNGSIGANEDATKDTAVAGVYTDENGGKNVVLLKDTTEAARLQPSVDMTINLGGKVLSSTDSLCVNASAGNIIIDGRISGSRIEMISAGASAARPVQVKAGCRIIVNGGTYACSSNGYTGTQSCFYLSGGADATIKNAKIFVSETTGVAVGVRVGTTTSGATAMVMNSFIEAISKKKAFGLENFGNTSVAACDVRAYSDYLYGDDEYYSASSNGIENTGSLTLNNCYIFGTHSGLSNKGILYVNGGTYEGYGHGGIYFSGENTASYVRNAIVRDCDMPNGYTATANRNGAGFYIGGYATANNNNIYMDNCDVYGNSKGQIIVLRGSSGEQNNSLYMSNSTIPEGAKIRIGNDTHKLYIGRGNNFTAENTDRPGAVIVTNEVYVQGVV